MSVGGLHEVFLSLWRLARSPRDLVILIIFVVCAGVVLFALQEVASKGSNGSVDILNWSFGEHQTEFVVTSAALFVIAALMLYLRRTVYDLEHRESTLKEKTAKLETAVRQHEGVDARLGRFKAMSQQDKRETMQLHSALLSALVGKALELAKQKELGKSDYVDFYINNKMASDYFDFLRLDAPEVWRDATHKIGECCVHFLDVLEGAVETGKLEPLRDAAEELRKEMREQQSKLSAVLRGLEGEEARHGA